MGLTLPIALRKGGANRLVRSTGKMLVKAPRRDAVKG